MHRKSTDERWALIRAAMEDQASGAMHVDPGTKDCKSVVLYAVATLAKILKKRKWPAW